MIVVRDRRKPDVDPLVSRQQEGTLANQGNAHRLSRETYHARVDITDGRREEEGETQQEHQGKLVVLEKPNTQSRVSRRRRTVEGDGDPDREVTTPRWRRADGAGTGPPPAQSADSGTDAGQGHRRRRAQIDAEPQIEVIDEMGRHRIHTRMPARQEPGGM